MQIVENGASAVMMREAIVVRHNGIGDPSTNPPALRPVVRVVRLHRAHRLVKGNGSRRRVIVRRRQVAGDSIVAQAVHVAIFKVANATKAAVSSSIVVHTSAHILSRPAILRTLVLRRW